MSISRELLVYASQLRRGEYARGWGGTPEIEEAVRQAIGDRMDVAHQFCQFAGRCLTNASAEIDYRNAISRAYYACHHGMRACLLAYQSGDEPDHHESIKAFADVVRSDRLLQTKLQGLAADVQDSLEKLMHHRHLADYYPYGTSYPLEGSIEWEAAAANDVALCKSLPAAITAFMAAR